MARAIRIDVAWGFPGADRGILRRRGAARQVGRSDEAGAVRDGIAPDRTGGGRVTGPARQIVAPPETSITAPLMYDASSEASHA